MPAIALTRVDLPAPLSPTRPTTSPPCTAKSTRSRAWTGPKRLLTPSSSRSGAPVAISPRDPGFFARFRVAARAQFGFRDEPVLDHGALHVVLGHRDRFEQHRRDLGLAVVRFVGDLRFREFFAFGEGDGDFRRDLRLLVSRLVDGHVLLAGEDALHAGDGR